MPFFNDNGSEDGRDGRDSADVPNNGNGLPPPSSIGVSVQTTVNQLLSILEHFERPVDPRSETESAPSSAFTFEQIGDLSQSTTYQSFIIVVKTQDFPAIIARGGRHQRESDENLVFEDMENMVVDSVQDGEDLRTDGIQPEEYKRVGRPGWKLERTNPHFNEDKSGWMFTLTVRSDQGANSNVSGLNA